MYRFLFSALHSDNFPSPFPRSRPQLCTLWAIVSIVHSTLAQAQAHRTEQCASTRLKNAGAAISGGMTVDHGARMITDGDGSGLLLPPPSFVERYSTVQQCSESAAALPPPWLMSDITDVHWDEEGKRATVS